MQTVGSGRQSLQVCVHMHLQDQKGVLNLILDKLRHLGTSCCPACSLTIALACAGSSSSNHCNAHGGQQLYHDMRTRAHAVGPDVTTPAPMPRQLHPPSPSPASNLSSTDEDSEEEDREDGSDSDVPWLPMPMGALYSDPDVPWAIRAARRHGLYGGDASASADGSPRPKQPMQSVERSNMLPDPALDDKLLEIGTIRLPIRVIANHIHLCTLPYHLHAVLAVFGHPKAITFPPVFNCCVF